MSWNLSISDMVKYRNHFVLICCQTINIEGKSRKVGVIIIQEIFIFLNFWHKMNTNNESKYEVEIKCSIFFKCWDYGIFILDCFGNLLIAYCWTANGNLVSFSAKPKGFFKPSSSVNLTIIILIVFVFWDCVLPVVC